MVLLRLLAFKPSAPTGVPISPVPARAAAEPEKKPLPEAVRAAEPLLGEPAEQLGVASVAVKVPVVAPNFKQKEPAVQLIRAQEAPQSIAKSTGLQAGPDAALGDHWASLVAQLISKDAIKSIVRELALQSQLQSQQGLDWTLRVESASLTNAAVVDKLQAAINAHRSPDDAVRLTTEMGPVEDTPVRRNQAAAQARQQHAEALIHSDPLVRDMVQNWGAKVVPGSIKSTASPATPSAQPI
jgi:DNA polymerase-3 subunit gamma/tau